MIYSLKFLNFKFFFLVGFFLFSFTSYATPGELKLKCISVLSENPKGWYPQSAKFFKTPQGDYSLHYVSTTDYLVEGSYRLFFQERIKGTSRLLKEPIEITPFAKTKRNSITPSKPADIEFSIRDDGLFVGYFRGSNSEHVLMLRAPNGQNVSIPIYLPVGSPSKIRANLGQLTWLKSGDLQYLPKQSLRGSRNSPTIISTRDGIESVAKKLAHLIERQALPDLSLEGSYFRPVQEGVKEKINQDFMRVELPSLNQKELVSYLYEHRHVSGFDLAIQNISKILNGKLRLVAVVKISEQQVDGTQGTYFYDIYSARKAFEQGIDISVSVYELELQIP